MFKGPSIVVSVGIKRISNRSSSKKMDKNARRHLWIYFEESGEMKHLILNEFATSLLKVARIKYLVESEDPELLRLMESDPLIRERFLNIANTQPWEIERALILAPGFSLVDSMRSLEIIAQGSRRSDFKGLFNFAQYITIIEV
jgi:hypothetical protein